MQIWSVAISFESQDIIVVTHKQNHMLCYDLVCATDFRCPLTITISARSLKELHFRPLRSIVSNDYLVNRSSRRHITLNRCDSSVDKTAKQKSTVVGLSGYIVGNIGYTSIDVFESEQPQEVHASCKPASLYRQNI